ncbi:hypothetical protein TNCV_3753041 [Trichonephila clavipes]|nr:hypothetical protein TNCV_3753041 [Trichonephila clavipes]
MCPTRRKKNVVAHHRQLDKSPVTLWPKECLFFAGGGHYTSIPNDSGKGSHKKCMESISEMSTLENTSPLINVRSHFLQESRDDASNQLGETPLHVLICHSSWIQICFKERFSVLGIRPIPGNGVKPW